MITIKELLLRYFVPTGLQVFYALVAALLISLYWCRTQLGERLRLPGSEESVQTFQELIKRFVDYWTTNDVIGFLSVALIWALVGIFILALVYETINIFITLRNDKLIATQFTHAEENKKIVLQTLTVKAVLIIGFIAFLFLALTVLFPFWHSLISQPSSHFFESTNILKEILGIVGLGSTLCFGWRWALALFSKLD